MTTETTSGAEKLKTNYTSNSHKSRDSKTERPEREKLEKVVVGTAIQQKKPLGRRVIETFTGDDAKSVGGFVLFDVILPAAKAMVSDAVSQGIERMLFGESKSRGRSGSSGSSSGSFGGGRSGYDRMYSGKAQSNSVNGRREMSNRSRSVHDFDEILIGSRGEAEGVLDKLTELVDNYETATVSDLYDLVGITGSFTDDKWGWYDLRGATISRARNGYRLNLPKTEVID